MTPQDPILSEFDRGYGDGVLNLPLSYPSSEYLVGYARGLLGREIIAKDAARTARCIANPEGTGVGTP